MSGIFNPGISVPLGGTVLWWTDTAPTNFLFCNGQAVSRTTYADLYALLGTTFGVGDGSTTFNLPDLCGRTVFGKETMGGASAPNPGRIQITTSTTFSSGSNNATVASAARLCVGMRCYDSHLFGGFADIATIVGTTLTFGSTVASSGTATARYSMLGDAQILGSSGGFQEHTLIADELASHTHTRDTQSTTTGTNVNRLVRGGGTSSGAVTTADAQAVADHSHNNLPPGMIGGYIIRAL